MGSRPHDVWKDILSRAKPGSDESQIASEALEMAIHEFESFLVTVCYPEEEDPRSPDWILEFVSGRSPVE